MAGVDHLELATDGTLILHTPDGEYNTARPLVIKAVLDYATYLVGSGSDKGWDIAVGMGRYAYVTGEPASVDVPIESPFQSAHKRGTDAFVSKLSPDGTALVYSTYRGGSNRDGDTSTRGQEGTLLNVSDILGRASP